MVRLTPEQDRLFERWQRSFPLVPRPYAVLAADIEVNENNLLRQLKELQEAGVLSRVGATVRPNSVGASLLAAMQVAPDDLERVAAVVSAEPTVNHNYEREHPINLWLVVTAADAASLAGALARLRAATGHDILELPLERAYYIDLGFALDGEWQGGLRPGLAAARTPLVAVEAADRRLLAALEDGLALVSRPYLALGRQAGLSEAAVIARLDRMVRGGIVSRLGLIVRHRALGFAANAMVVWDIPDADIDAVGSRFADEPCVTLCYRRPRRPPAWPYNFFCMIHGRDRSTVEAQAEALARKVGIGSDKRAILFSRRCFKQRGARFKAA